MYYPLWKASEVCSKAKKTAQIPVHELYLSEYLADKDDQYRFLKVTMSLTRLPYNFLWKDEYWGLYLTSKYNGGRDAIVTLDLTNKEIRFLKKNLNSNMVIVNS